MSKTKTGAYVLVATLSIIVAGGLTLLYLNRKKVFGKFSRVSNLNKRIIDLAENEYNEWNKGGVKRKENDPAVFGRLKDYWERGSNTFWSKSRMIGEAWSAAFISYVMKLSGAGDNFKYSTSHSVYIRDAIRNRKEGNKNPFKGYRPDEVEVEKGDLVCFARQGGVGYDTTGSYKSHCDIVVDVSNNEAIGIGGNVSNSVSKTKYPLLNGRLAGSKPFVVIKNEA